MNDSIFNATNLNVVVDTNSVELELLTMIAKSRGLKLKTYEYPERFLREIDQFDSSVTFFFGNRFGPFSKISGSDLARAVKGRYFSPVFLVTMYEPQYFVEELASGLIQLVLPKEMYMSEPYCEGELSQEEVDRFDICKKVLRSHADNSWRFHSRVRPHWLCRLSERKYVTHYDSNYRIVTNDLGLTETDAPKVENKKEISVKTNKKNLSRHSWWQFWRMPNFVDQI